MPVPWIWFVLATCIGTDTSLAEAAPSRVTEIRITANDESSSTGSSAGTSDEALGPRVELADGEDESASGMETLATDGSMGLGVKEAPSGPPRDRAGPEIERTKAKNRRSRRRPASGTGRSAGGGRSEWRDRWAPQRNTWAVGFLSGASIPGASRQSRQFRRQEDDARVGLDSTGVHLGGRLEYFPLRVLGLSAGGGGILGPDPDSGALEPKWSVRGGIVGQLPWRVTPIVVAGAGALQRPTDGFDGSKRWVGAGYYGGGLMLYLTSSVALRFLARETITYGYRDKGLAYAVDVLGGVVVTLRPWSPPLPRRRHDMDQDGVKDPDDRCPQESGLMAYDGCPVPDGDHDGLSDLYDLCPHAAGEPRLRGCPRNDTDGDGLLDAFDDCPLMPGLHEDGGCGGTDVDRDGDGIPDSKDACVVRPENIDLFEDHDGCPEKIPSKVTEILGVSEQVDFVNSRAALRPESRATLEHMARVLTSYPRVHIEILVHTGTRGDAKYNVGLSQRRAESIRRALMELGVEGTRMAPVGAGEARPSEGATSASRSVEFQLAAAPVVAP